MRTVTLIVVLAAFVSAVAVAQQAKPAFEVASVKRNTSGAPGFGGPTATSGRRPMGFSATNVTLPMLIRTKTYGFDDDRIVGGPDWV